MIRGLIEPVRSILAELHDLTGKELHFVLKPDLKSLARLRMAASLCTWT